MTHNKKDAPTLAGVVTLKTLPEARRDQIVEALKTLLAEAEAGEMSEVLVVYMPSNDAGGISWRLCPGVPSARMLGSVDIVKHILISRMMVR